MPAIVRWSSSASPIAARRVLVAQAAQERGLVELGGEDVGPEAGQPLVEARARLGHQLEHRAPGAGRRPARRAGAPARPCDGTPGRRRAPARSRSCAGASGSPGRPRSAGTGACRGRRPTAPPGRRAARASGRGRSAGAAWRSRPAPGPPAPAGSGSPRSGWCRPRALSFRVRLQHSADRRSLEVCGRGRLASPCSGGSPPWASSSWPRSASRSASCSSTSIEQRALDRAVEHAQVIAQLGVQTQLAASRPPLPDHARAPQRARPRARRPLLRRRSGSSRVKLFNRDGRLVYSDDRSIIGGCGLQGRQRRTRRSTARSCASSSTATADDGTGEPTCSRSTCRCGSRPAASRPACSSST